jgi:hypothetical protein
MARKKMTGTAETPDVISGAQADMQAKRDRRKKILASSRGLSDAKLQRRVDKFTSGKTAETEDTMRSRVLARLLENRSLDEGWRDEARGDVKHPLGTLHDARYAAAGLHATDEDEAALTEAQAAAKAYRERRREMLAAAQAAAPPDVPEYGAPGSGPHGQPHHPIGGGNFNGAHPFGGNRPAPSNKRPTDGGPGNPFGGSHGGRKKKRRNQGNLSF